MKQLPKRPPADGAIWLRPLEDSDLPTTLAWRNHDDSRIWFKTTDSITEEDHRAWFTKYSEKQNDIVFVVLDENDLVGQVAIYDINLETRTAEVGRFLIDPMRRRRGYLRRALHLLAEYAQSIGLERITLDVRSDNRAITAYEQFGFVETKRDAEYVYMAKTLQATI